MGAFGVYRTICKSEQVVAIKKGNYIRVDTTTRCIILTTTETTILISPYGLERLLPRRQHCSRQRENVNQQLKQLVSYLSLRFERFFQQLARQSKAPQKVTNFFGDPALLAALNEKFKIVYTSLKKMAMSQQMVDF